MPEKAPYSDIRTRMLAVNRAPRVPMREILARSKSEGTTTS